VAVEGRTLAQLIDPRTREGELWTPRSGARVRCVACGHRCVIPPGQRGICKVRFNADGRLRVPWGYVAGLQLDPVEKKPFFHAYPGATALSFGMLGCDLHCAYCQNALTSQALRDPAMGVPPRDVRPADVVAAATRAGARVLASTYNEPLITAEWAVEVFRAGRPAGLAGAFVSNGHATPEVLDYLRPWVDLYKVDLKAFRDRTYRQLGGLLRIVCETIQGLHARGAWLEVVTLVVPGLNDDAGELRDAAGFLASVSRDIPWHVTAFHPDYRMEDRPATPAAVLVRAAELGIAAGLRYVYAGNLPGRVGPCEDTRCPTCGTTVVRRRGFRVLERRVDACGRCEGCGAALAGRWGA
jgi:pyruvate formate lyase activating enzyme